MLETSLHPTTWRCPTSLPIHSGKAICRAEFRKAHNLPGSFSPRGGTAMTTSTTRFPSPTRRRCTIGGRCGFPSISREVWLVLAVVLYKEWFGTNTRVRASNLFHLLSPLSSYTTFCDDTTPPDATITTSCCDHSVDRGPRPWFTHLRESDTEIGSLQDSEPSYRRLPQYPPTLHGTLPTISRSEGDLYVRLRHPQFARPTTK